MPSVAPASPQAPTNKCIAVTYSNDQNWNFTILLLADLEEFQIM